MRALATSGRSVREIAFVTSGIADVVGGEHLNPRAAVLLGPVMVIPEECPGTACRCIDLDDRADHDRAVDVVRELAHPIQTPLTAWRGRYRWLPRFEALTLPASSADAEPFREGGTYLITGRDWRMARPDSRRASRDNGSRESDPHEPAGLCRQRPRGKAWRPLRQGNCAEAAWTFPLLDLEPQIAMLERGIERTLNIQVRERSRRGCSRWATRWRRRSRSSI